MNREENIFSVFYWAKPGNCLVSIYEKGSIIRCKIKKNCVLTGNEQLEVKDLW